MTSDFDTLFAEAELLSGVPLAIVQARNPSARISKAVLEVPRQKSPVWNSEEEEFVRQMLGQLPMDEIGRRLGRSGNAIKIRMTRKEMPAPSKRHGWLTGQKVADVLGTDVHAICSLVDRGLLPMTRLPVKRSILAIRYEVLTRWSVNPENWPYFIRSVRDTGRICDPHLARLIERQKERWGDEWWTMGETAAYLGVSCRQVNTYMCRGLIARGVKWGNWFFKKSKVTGPGFIVYKGKGGAKAAQSEAGWNPAADAFILKARADGLTWSQIAHKMKMKEARVRHRGYTLLKRVKGE